ncbi:MAG TPA: M4 family metallopeptidase [Holophaga sp.]|nr:M4 family metallopeptidase [Holophaga sp.]
MRLPPRGLRAGLALCLAAGFLPAGAAAPLPAAQIQALKARQSERAASALRAAMAAAPSLGLPEGASLTLRSAFTTPEGRTVTRMDQRLDGYRVFGAAAIAHVEADGSVQVLGDGLMPDARLTAAPTLTAAQASAIGLKQAALKGQAPAPRVELMVFPTRFCQGLKAVLDAATGKAVLDRAATVVGRPSQPYVWAYKVDVTTMNSQDGVVDMEYLVDARTGGILRKMSNLRPAEAPSRVQGTGLGQYVGQVTLETTQEADGTYSLHSQVHGSRPNPFFQRAYNQDLVGLTTFYEMHDLETWGYISEYYGNPDNLWGDGFPFMDYPNEGLKNGETAAVDAHYGVSLTWDMYRDVFGRNGLDGDGTTPFALVHMRNPGTGMKFDNAMWSDGIFGMLFGDGSFYPDRLMRDPETGLPYPGNAQGMMSLTELDVAGHELSHGLTFASAGLDYQGESGGLNEASSDIMGTLVEAYHFRPKGQDDAIPNYGNDWQLGGKCRPSGPLRYMDRPSRDGLSADNWYEGIEWMEVHYSSGPMNRCFHFLSAGAPADPASERYSAYLPQGMDGIGNDAAGRIWFKALTEYMTPTTNYHQAGAAMVKAAGDLYGPSSREAAATRKALTAINVQVDGEPLLARVSFPRITTGVLGNYEGAEFLARTAVVPLGTTVRLKADVANAADKTVTWKIGAHRAAIAGPGEADPTGVGVVNADGTWTAPLRSGFFFITAASKARPEQYAEGLVFIQDLDADGDSDQDAIDMGASACSWNLSQVLKWSHSPYGGSWVDDLDVELFQTAIKNAWGKP